MISIIHPSRSRPEQAMNTAVNWSITTADAYEYILVVDHDDPSLKEYVEGFPPSVVNISHSKNVVQAANYGASLAKGDILVLISDDFECFRGWDLVVKKALEGKSGLLKTFDGVQKWIVTLPIMTRDYYQSQEHIYYPDFGHMFCDTDQTHKADLQKKLIIRNDIVFKHNHHSIKGGVLKDDINRRADSTWQSGERAYLKRCKEKFGLGNIDIFNLSKEAKEAGHVDWLKKKLHVR